MVFPSLIFAATSTMQAVRDICTVIGALCAVAGVVIGAMNILRSRRKTQASRKGGPVSYVIKVVQIRSIALMVFGLAIIALSASVHRVIRLPGALPVRGQSYNGASFPVMANYHPSGLMGDTGDLKPTARMEGADQFTYEPLGKGPHEWDYKYVNGMLNEKPAQFAGVMYLRPRGNWGTDAKGGTDLSDVADVVQWEARSAEGDVYVEFVIGGITWKWDETAKKKVAAPHPDSLPSTSLGTYKLTPEWRSIPVDLREKGRTKDEFNKVLGGFGWVITWAANGLEAADDGLSPEEKRVFKIELRNIRYERKQK